MGNLWKNQDLKIYQYGCLPKHVSRTMVMGELGLGGTLQKQPKIMLTDYTIIHYIPEL